MPSTDLEKSWGCRTGREWHQREVHSPGRSDPRLSQRDSWDPRCWKKPHGSASIHPWCGSVCRQWWASQCPSTPGRPGLSCWWNSGPARPWGCHSSSTWKQQIHSENGKQINLRKTNKKPSLLKLTLHHLCTVCVNCVAFQLALCGRMCHSCFYDQCNSAELSACGPSPESGQVCRTQEGCGHYFCSWNWTSGVCCFQLLPMKPNFPIMLLCKETKGDKF